MNGQKDIDNLVKIIRRNGGEWIEGGHGIPVMTGKRDGVTIDAGQGKIWVRFSNGQEMMVVNDFAPMAIDLHITIGHLRSDPNTWRVREYRNTYLNYPESSVRPHAFQHELNGFDQVSIDRKQVISATAFVSDNENFLVRIFGGLFPILGGWAMGDSTNGDTQPDVDLSSYIPTAGAKYTSIEEDSSGTIVINDTGDLAPAKELLTFLNVPIVPAGNRMICFALLYEGQPQLLNEHIYLPGLFMPDYASVETGYQIDNAPAGTPVNPDKFGFFKVSDDTLRNITWEDLLGLIVAAATSTTRWVPLANGDPADPSLVFDANGNVIMILEDI